MARANAVPLSGRDDVLSLAAAPAIDAFNTVLRYSFQLAKEGSPAITAATLKDAADDLRALDLLVLAGRYLARRTVNERDNPNPYSSLVELIYVLEVWVRRKTEDLAHVVDRSNEPMWTSDEEQWSEDDEVWLAWEGKRRLFLWPGDDAELSGPGVAGPDQADWDLAARLPLGPPVPVFCGALALALRDDV